MKSVPANLPVVKSVAALLCVIFLLSPVLAPAQEDSDKKPSAAGILERAIEESGAGVVAGKYAELKTEEDRYDFNADEFIRFGHRLLQEDRVPEAVAILEIAVERFPDARWSWFLMANAYWRDGQPERALDSRVKMQDQREKAQLDEFLAENRDSLATTAEQVIEKHLEAIGGREALSKVETMVVKFGINDTNGRTMALTRHYKRPAYYRQGVDGADRFVATDGETVWSVNGGEWKETDDPWYRHVGRIDGFFADYAEHGVSYRFAGVEILNHAPVYRLTRTFSDGAAEDLYFSIETGLLTEKREQYPQSYPVMLSYMSFWDYRDVGGIRIPHVFIRNVGVLGPPHGGVVEDVQVNVPLDDSLFVKPR